jgi:hypothetical protein
MACSPAPLSNRACKAGRKLQVPCLSMVKASSKARTPLLLTRHMKYHNITHVYKPTTLSTLGLDSIISHLPASSTLWRHSRSSRKDLRLCQKSTNDTLHIGVGVCPVLFCFSLDNSTGIDYTSLLILDLRHSCHFFPCDSTHYDQNINTKKPTKKYPEHINHLTLHHSWATAAAQSSQLSEVCRPAYQIPTISSRKPFLSRGREQQQWNQSWSDPA